MVRVNDLGGRPEKGAIDRREHEPAWWEKRTDAMVMLLAAPGRRLITIDEHRRAIECLDPGEYASRRYYERWLLALERLLVEKGVLTPEEIDRRAADLEREAATP